MASTKPVEVTVKKIQLGEIKAALEVLDNPNSGGDDPKERPRKYKYKNSATTRYDLAANFRAVFEAWRIVDKVRKDIVRLKMDEQLKARPDSDQLEGRWNQDAMKDIEALWDQDITLSLRQIPLANLDLETNAIPFTAIAILIGNVIVADDEDGEADAD